MKNFTKSLLLTMLFNLLWSSTIYGQYFEIPILQKSENSDIIVEGEVIAQKSFFGSDTKIYTQNIIKITDLHKGVYFEDNIAVITRGGTVGDTTTIWSHMLSLQLKEYGVFFLKKSNVDSEELNITSNYKPYSGIQGFYHFQKNDSGAYIVRSELEQFNSINEFYKAINISKTLETFNYNQLSSKEDKCIEFQIEPILNNSFDSSSDNFQQNQYIWFNLLVRHSETDKKLNKSEFIVKYSTEWFHSYMHSNGYIEYNLGEFSESAYNFNISDISENTIKFSLEARTTDYSSLESITTNWKSIATIGVLIKNISNETPIENIFNDNYDMENNYMAEDGYIEEFNCVKFSAGANCGMEITSITPIAAAGVDLMSENGISGVIEIIGDNFIDGEPTFKCNKPENHHVKFRTIDNDWIAPLEGDYLLYTNTKIRVKVPSIGYLDNSSNIITDLNSKVACSGQVRVCRDGLLGIACGCFVTSSEELYIPFSARNQVAIDEDGCQRSIRVLLRDVNDNGGYTIYFENDFKMDASAMTAFKNALTTWRCATLVNFDVNEVDPFPNGVGDCLVGFDDLPVGTTTTRAQTSVSGPFCGAPPSQNFAEIIEFEIMFNENITWNGSGTADLESTALHELGHAHLLNHTCNGEDKVMHPSKNIVVQDLNIDDENGGDHISILGSSVVDDQCPFEDAMILINISECTVSTKELSIDGKNVSVTIYPNPSTQIINVELTQLGKIEYHLELYNWQGKIVDFLYPTENTITFSTSDLPVGSYFLILQTTQSKMAIGQFIKTY